MMAMGRPMPTGLLLHPTIAIKHTGQASFTETHAHARKQMAHVCRHVHHSKPQNASTATLSAE